VLIEESLNFSIKLLRCITLTQWPNANEAHFWQKEGRKGGREGGRGKKEGREGGRDREEGRKEGRNKGRMEGRKDGQTDLAEFPKSFSMFYIFKETSI
jgi:hypothetical protein